MGYFRKTGIVYGYQTERVHPGIEGCKEYWIAGGRSISILQSWDLAASGELTEAQLKWFKAQFRHEITEAQKMAEGLPLHDKDTWNIIKDKWDIDKLRNAHDAADLQPDTFPGSTQSEMFEKYWNYDKNDEIVEEFFK